MAYITQTDLDEYLSDKVLEQLTDDDNAGEINTDKVDECITGAEDEVNGIIAVKYTVPLSTTPGIITEICIVLACYRLYLRRQRVPEDFRQMVTDVRGQLEDIRDGNIKLPGDPTPAATVNDEPEFYTRTRVNSRDTWSGW